MAKREELFRLLKQIPPRQVVSYSQLGRLLNLPPRTAGRLLHQNTDSQIPCFRVVRQDGSLANGYKFGGRDAQRKRLRAATVPFQTPNQVATQAFWQPTILFFDIDDCLFPTHRFKAALWQLLARQIGLSPIALARYYRQYRAADHYRQGFPNGFQHWLKEKQNLAINLPAILDQFWLQQGRKFRRPKLLPLFRRLAGHFLLGIFSQGDPAVQRRKLAILGLDQFFLPSLIFIAPTGKQTLAAKIKRLTPIATSHVFDNLASYGRLFSPPVHFHHCPFSHSLSIIKKFEIRNK